MVKAWEQGYVTASFVYAITFHEYMNKCYKWRYTPILWLAIVKLHCDWTITDCTSGMLIKSAVLTLG